MSQITDDQAKPSTGVIAPLTSQTGNNSNCYRLCYRLLMRRSLIFNVSYLFFKKEIIVRDKMINIKASGVIVNRNNNPRTKQKEANTSKKTCLVVMISANSQESC